MKEYKYLNLFLLFIIILFLGDVMKVEAVVLDAEPGGNSVEITDDYDTRTKSSMLADKFDELFHDSKLEGLGKKVIEEANKNGVNAGFMGGVMAQETGWGRNSSMLNDLNNPGGLTCKSGSSGDNWSCVARGDRHWKKFTSVEAAIEEKAAYLKRMYHDDGLFTIIQIQKRYCPDGDGCDTWRKGVRGAMVKLGEGNGGGLLDSTNPDKKAGTGYDTEIPPSIFSEYEIEIDNIGINDKSNHDTSYQNYKVNKLTGKLIEIFYNVTFALGIVLFGYISILWMALLLARTRFEPAYKVVESLTGGRIDAFEDLGKLIKLTIVLMVVVGVALSGLIPMVFALVYKVLSIFISGVFRL